MLTCSLIQLCVYGQTDLINNNVNTIALSDIAELIQFIPKFNTEYKGVLREIRLDNFNYMGRLLFLAGGYSCSWMVTNDPGVTLPPHRGRVSGTQGQRWWVLLLLGTAGPPTPAAARARGKSNDLNREILASNLFNCHKEVINAPPFPSISRCIHVVYRHKNVWEYQWSNFIYNCMSTFLHYVHCKDALLDCSAPDGERCESLTWVDEIQLCGGQFVTANHIYIYT